MQSNRIQSHPSESSQDQSSHSDSNGFRPGPTGLGWPLLAGVGAAAGLWWATSTMAKRRSSFSGKVVVITGGSRGLGLILARRFAQEGARIALIARDEKELEFAADDIRSLGAEVLPVVCDVTLASEVHARILYIAEQMGGIDVLVNNAGMIRVAPLENTTASDYRAAMDVHFWGPLYCTLEALPFLKRSQMPRILNITSIGGLVAVPHLLPYCASKFAAVGFSRGLRTELARHGIKVTTVCPGTMRTGSYRQAEFKGNHEAEFRWFAFSSSVPGISMSAERAAKQMVEAARSGQAELITPLQVKLASRAQVLFPDLFAAVMALVNAMLPAPATGLVRKGAQIPRSRLTDAVSTLSRQAAVRNNEYASLIKGQH